MVCGYLFVRVSGGEARLGGAPAGGVFRRVVAAAGGLAFCGAVGADAGCRVDFGEYVGGVDDGRV